MCGIKSLKIEFFSSQTKAKTVVTIYNCNLPEEAKILLTTPPPSAHPLEASTTLSDFWEIIEVLYTHTHAYHHPSFTSQQDLMLFLKKNPSLATDEHMSRFFEPEGFKTMKMILEHLSV